MTLKQLGVETGFLESRAGKRIAEFESGENTPGDKLIPELARSLGISPYALKVPDIDSIIGLAHTLFALEDIYGLKIEKDAEGLCLRLKNKSGHANGLYTVFSAWQEQASKMEAGEITRDDYDQWRYNYPDRNTTI